MGPFRSSNRGKYIFFPIDFVSKWVEAVALPDNESKSVTLFLKRNIFQRFGTPQTIISDGGSYFRNGLFRALFDNYGLIHNVTTPYHPQSSGYVKVSNREIKKILQKTMNAKRMDWSRKLDDSIQAYRTTFKTPIGMPLYQFEFGKYCHLLVELANKAM